MFAHENENALCDDKALGETRMQKGVHVQVFYTLYITILVFCALFFCR